MTQKKLIEDPSKIELRSHELKEILSRPPAWLVRRGTSLFFLILVVLLFISWILKYPDVIRNNRIVLTTQTPPVLIVPRASGPLVALLVHDRQNVTKGEILAVIENPADYRHMLEMKTSLNIFQTGFDENLIRNFKFRNDARLGELEPAFAAFIKNISDLKHFYNLRLHELKIESYRYEATGHIAYRNILNQQNELLQAERNLIYRKFQRDSSLFANGVIPESVFEQVKSDLLIKDQSMEQARLNISAVDIILLKLNQSILQMELDYRNTLNQLQNDFSESLEKLNGQIALWEQRYLLKATSSGMVGFSEYWSPGQQVREGDAVFVIVPEDEGEILGRLALPLVRSGKVKTGQKVLVKLDNFPHMEFGMLTGHVSSISLVPAQEQFVVDVIFPDGMRTNYGLKLPFSQEMRGLAEIITEDMRLIQRILNPVRSAIQRNRTP